MYFTYFLLEGNEVDRSEIYYSTRSGRGWASPQKVNGLPENGIVKHPSTGTLLGQQVLFYAYNGSGQGGFDLFYSPLHSRSEEHTSELQSRGHLVCRLLLEKKKR